MTWPPKDGWFAVPRFALEAVPVIGPSSFTVYCLFCRRADSTGQCWPSIRSIVEDTGLSPRSVRRSLEVLEEVGFVTVTRRKSDRDRNLTNIYQLVDNPPPLPTSGKKDSTSKSASNTTGKNDTGVLAKRTGGRRPIELDPLRTRPTSTSPKLRFTDDDMGLAVFILEAVKRLDPKTKQPNLKSWANTIRLMREQDSRTPEQIRGVFTWANADDFWQSNILCPAKLREKFSTLLVKSKGPQHGNRKQHSLSGQRHDPSNPIASTL